MTRHLWSPTNNRDRPTNSWHCLPASPSSSLIVARLISGVGVGFRRSPKVPQAGFWLTAECWFVDGGSVNRRGEIRALLRGCDRIPICLRNDCVVNLKAIVFLTFEHVVLR